MNRWLGCWLHLHRHVWHPVIMDGCYNYRYCRRCPVWTWRSQ